METKVHPRSSNGAHGQTSFAGKLSDSACSISLSIEHVLLRKHLRVAGIHRVYVICVFSLRLAVFECDDLECNRRELKLAMNSKHGGKYGHCEYYFFLVKGADLELTVIKNSRERNEPKWPPCLRE